MDYYINPAAMKSLITVPAAAVNENLKLASALQLKVLLYCFTDTAREISAEGIACALGADCDEVCDALELWMQKGVLLKNGEQPAAAEEKKEKETLMPDELPSREDVARRGNEDGRIRMLLREAQQKFGRNLKTNESSTLVWLYDDKGMDISLLLLLIQYAANNGKMRMGFIRKTALEWLDLGVENVAEGEQYFATLARQEISWRTVSSAFGIERKLAGKREQEFSDKWVGEWGFSKEMLREAYSICVDNLTKLSYPYINTVLEGWHKKGIKRVEDIVVDEKPKKSKNKGIGEYDIDAFENMLDDE